MGHLSTKKVKYMSIKKNLQMIFTLSDNKKFSYDLADPKPDLTRPQVETVMTDIINKNLINKDNVAVTGINSITVRTVENIEL